MMKLTRNNVYDFAINNNIYLSNDELNFTYEFIKKNWQEVIKNPSNLHLEKYKEIFSNENFSKIEKLFQEYSLKFKNYF